MMPCILLVYHEILEVIFIFYFIAAVSTSAMGGCDIDPRKGHHLSAKFVAMLGRVGVLLEKCTNVDVLKTFLKHYKHPLYPDKLYVEPHVYRHAETVRDIVYSLFPMYINYTHYYILEAIVEIFGNEECKEVLQEYKQFFQRSVRKLEHHPTPMTDEEIEAFSGQSRLIVTTSGDARATTPHDLQRVQEAISQATGVNQSGLVFGREDPGNSTVSPGAFSI